MGLVSIGENEVSLPTAIPDVDRLRNGHEPLCNSPITSTLTQTGKSIIGSPSISEAKGPSA